MTITKKIIQHIGGSDYETLITRRDVFWTFLVKDDLTYALNIHPTIGTVQLTATPRLVLKLMKVL